MKPSSYQCIGHERLSSTNNSSVVTATVPPGTSAVLIGIETTSARMTLTPTGDPTSSTGLLLLSDTHPYLSLVGQGAVYKFASTAGTVSVIQLAYLG